MANLAFTLADASTARLGAKFHEKGQTGEAVSACYKEAERRVDLVVALHACGALSDVAVAQAVRHKAGFVVCPCCFNANQFLRVPVEIPPTEDPAEAPAALASSSASVPVSVSAADWLGLPAASLAALLAAADLQGDHAAASEAAQTVCALRLEAAQRHWAELWAELSEQTGASAQARASAAGEKQGCREEVGNAAAGGGGALRVSLRQFPIAFSTRNLCLVGAPHSPE